MNLLSKPLVNFLSFRTTFKCRVEEVRGAVEQVRKFLHAQHIASNDINGCVLAISEACNNAVQYVTGGGTDKNIQITAVIGRDELEFTVIDHTPGFIWTDRMELPPEDSEGGRGLYLIQNIMDHAEYVLGVNGNSLIMRKTRSSDSGTRAIQVTGSLPQFEPRLRDLDLNVFMKNIRDRSVPGTEKLFAFLNRQQKKEENLHEHIRRMLEDMLKILSADWFVLRLLKKNRILQVFLSSEQQSLLKPIVIDSENDFIGIEELCFKERKVLHAEPTIGLQTQDPLNYFRHSSSIVASPLIMSDQLLGTLTVGRYEASDPLSTINSEILRTFVDFLSIQFFGAEMMNFVDPSEQHELEIARCLQQAILPKTLPHIKGFSLAGFCHSAKTVGGDFYDVIPLDESTFMLVIADVMGKGIPAAMYAAIMRSVLRAILCNATSPSDLLARVNDVLYEILSNLEIFITAQVIFLNMRTGECTLSNAGHCPCLICRDGKIEILSPEGMPLGIFPNLKFDQTTIVLEPEAQLLLYTDGLIEARDPAGNIFGQDRIARCMQTIWERKMPAQQSVMHLNRELMRFQNMTPNVDDQTALILSGIIK